VLRVCHQLCRGPRLAAQLRDELPVLGAGPHESCRGSSHELVREVQGFVERGRTLEYPRVGHYPDEPHQRERGQREGFRAGRERGEPRREPRVFGVAVFAMGVDQHVHVGK
jgi:hypothetical protein